MQFAGTPVVEIKGGAVLNNCGFLSTQYWNGTTDRARYSEVFPSHDRVQKANQKAFDVQPKGRHRDLGVLCPGRGGVRIGGDFHRQAFL